MKVALIRTDRNSGYVDGLSMALKNSGHSVTVIAEDRELPVHGQRLGSNPGLRRSALQFSSDIHKWLIQNGPHVVEAPYLNYPLLVEQIAGGTPTVVRYEPEQSDVDFDVSLHDNWTRHTLELSTVRQADVVVTSKDSVVKAGQNIRPMKKLPLGISRPATTCSTHEERFGPRSGFNLYCPEEWIQFFKNDMEGVSVNLCPLSEFEKITDFSLFMDLRGIGVFSEWMDENRILTVMSTGCPVIHSHVGPDYSDWPLLWVDQIGSDSFRRLPSILKVLESRSELSVEVAKFASRYFWSNLIGHYISTYKDAVKSAWKTGRVRGW